MDSTDQLEDFVTLHYLTLFILLILIAQLLFRLSFKGVTWQLVFHCYATTLRMN